MKAIVLRELGSPDKLRLEDVPDPKPGPGEVIIRLKAAALNHRDVWLWKGKYPGLKLPTIPGSDGAGKVLEMGTGVEGLRDGQDVVINPGLDWGSDPRVQGADFRILGMPDDGTYAELIKVPASNVHRKPAGLSYEQAAAIPLAALTAYRAVVTKAEVHRGETVLVTGIGGGVSTFAAAIARRLGARVLATSGSDEKLGRARKELGVEEGVNSKAGDWGRAILDLTGGRGPDVVIDSVGGATFARAVEITATAGRVVTFGATTGPSEPIDLFRLFWKQVRILGTTMGTPAEFAAMLDLYEDGGLKPILDRTFPLAEAPAAHRRMEEAEQFGKIILKID
ncbi:zinc-binding dehydrogenase [soil metagenome]